MSRDKPRACWQMPLTHTEPESGKNYQLNKYLPHIPIAALTIRCNIMLTKMKESDIVHLGALLKQHILCLL